MGRLSQAYLRIGGYFCLNYFDEFFQESATARGLVGPYPQNEQNLASTSPSVVTIDRSKVSRITNSSNIGLYIGIFHKR